MESSVGSPRKASSIPVLVLRLDRGSSPPDRDSHTQDQNPNDHQRYRSALPLQIQDALGRDSLGRAQDPVGVRSNYTAMFGPRIKLDKALYERASHIARIAGYATVDEFVSHVLERELEALESVDDKESAEKIAERMRGLGYL